MKNIVLSIAFVAVSAMGMAQSRDFKKDVLEYIEVAGSEKAMMVQLEQIFSQVPVSKQEDFKKELAATLPAFKEQLAEVMMKTYTQEEITALLKFYNSPIGKTIASKQEELTKKSAKIGEKWGEEYLMPILMKYFN
ncbi:DUF2059 domain-containing protein [Capnocytophaga sp. ARDL2]|uniref:DUF2059 domain-containing protein n=1 Tax=Capnocytophaga sp. ARDL2 TaxID=3238809 RepID=UPI003558BF51